MRVSDAYLVIYNLVSLFGWGVILTKTLISVARGDSFSDMFSQLEFWLQIFQTTAILELVHSMLGLVRSPLATAAIQVYSRVSLVWAVLFKVPQARDSIGVLMILIAWSVTEVVRYSFYALHILGSVPTGLLWCRYSFFILLYPLGASGELFIIWRALPEVWEKQHLSLPLPNPANISFSFYVYLIGYMITYIPGFPKMYLHMFGQRKKVLGTDASKKTA